MRVSNNGLAIIKKYEGLSLESYLCPAKRWTIGYGHIKTTVPYMKISEPQAECLLRKDVEESERAVTRRVKTSITQSQFDALVSFTFNLGEGNLAKSTLLDMVNEHDTMGAVLEFAKWNKARVNGKLVALAGLTARRAAEASLYMSGVVYDFGEAGVIPDDN